MPLTIKEFLADFATAQHQEWDKTRISIMVFGPNTDGKTIGSCLRKYIIKKCNEYGVVVRTEHKDFRDIHEGIFGPDRNLCFAEINAAKHVNAIIMIPDSPGSLVELGMLSPLKELHRKIMILFRDKFNSPEAKKSFVYLGPKLAYDESKTPIEYINYRKKEEAWQKVKPFLHEMKANKYESDTVRKLVP